jgi:hypothetical protein
MVRAAASKWIDELGERQSGLFTEPGKTRVAITEQLNGIRDDIGVNMGAANAMRRANENTRELVRLQGEQLSLMRRKINRPETRLREITGERQAVSGPVSE